MASVSSYGRKGFLLLPFSEGLDVKFVRLMPTIL